MLSKELIHSHISELSKDIKDLQLRFHIYERNPEQEWKNIGALVSMIKSNVEIIDRMLEEYAESLK